MKSRVHLAISTAKKALIFYKPIFNNVWGGGTGYLDHKRPQILIIRQPAIFPGGKPRTPRHLYSKKSINPLQTQLLLFLGGGTGYLERDLGSFLQLSYRT